MRGERLFEVRYGIIQTPLLGVDDAKVAQHGAERMAIAEIAVDGNRGFEMRCRFVDPTLVATQVAQATENCGFAAAVVQVSRQRECLIYHAPTLFGAAGEAQRHAKAREDLGALRGIGPDCRQQLAPQRNAERAWTEKLDDFIGGAIAVHCHRRISALRRAGKRRYQIVELERQHTTALDTTMR
jgi:hypothetical protein